MNWEIAKADHIGGRNEQQDSIATFSTDNDQVHLLVVADGMGGHQGGNLASQIVIETAQLFWNKHQQNPIMEPHQFLQQVCEKAHLDINLLGKKHEISSRSTCVLLYIDHKKAWWAYVGDSRLYHFRGKKLLFRTRDHSVVQLLADLGRIKEEEMATHPDQSRLLKGLGGDDPVKPDFGQSSVHFGDTFVLCSDGFWEHVSFQKMSERLRKTDIPLKKRIKILVKNALDAGGKKGDNIAIAAAQLPSLKRFNIWTYAILIIIISLTFLIGGLYLK